MSDGIRDVDITYRRLLALKKAHKKDASVAREVFKLLGRSPSKGTLNMGTTPLTITTIATESFWIVDGRMTLS
ncbi:hypothetical protein PRIPAC_89307 [Pristionchus pacificus]|uniref:Uncharacterized protein n=1 Tax=Pristionchus pacificus TaxID=54126 RepID=A0A2A6B6H8_PRIPA|nr:hypothetical protein PRIPAC_89307 [Pristionchus pacificus]|eukprot:PDM61490.1 hypothetical protein PRIPAC_50932 [Pristionchus pacificus]